MLCKLEIVEAKVEAIALSRYNLFALHYYDLKCVCVCVYCCNEDCSMCNCTHTLVYAYCLCVVIVVLWRRLRW